MSNSMNARDATSAWRSRTRAFFCSTSDCDEPATNPERRAHEGEQPFYGEPWQLLRAIAPQPLEYVRTLPRPNCFHLGGGREATEGIRHLDGTSVNVCEGHFDDLSWVTPDWWDQ